MLRICIIDGHPDPADGHLVSALAQACAEGARDAGHEVSMIRIAAIDIPLLQNAAAFALAPPDAIRAAQDKIAEADHLIFLFPLWLGTMPAVCKAFWEQAARGGFLLDTGDKPDQWPQRKMKGKTVRIIVTMGMPALAYRLLFGAHSVKAMEAGIFRISGFRHIRHTIFGGIGAIGADRYADLLDQCRKLGAKAG